MQEAARLECEEGLKELGDAEALVGVPNDLVVSFR